MNPFVYGEIAPLAAFVDREAELDRLVSDLVEGQKIFLISPRRFGKSSLIHQALRAASRRGVLVSSYSSYVAFLEGYARARVSVETRFDRLGARAVLQDVLGGCDDQEVRRLRAPGCRPVTGGTLRSGRDESATKARRHERARRGYCRSTAFITGSMRTTRRSGFEW